MKLRNLVLGSLVAIGAFAGPMIPAHAETACTPVQSSSAAEGSVDNGILCVVASCTDTFVDNRDVNKYLSCMA